MLLSCHVSVGLGQFPVVEFVEQACVDSWELPHGYVNPTKPFPVPVQQELGHVAGDGSGVFRPGQLLQVHPLTAEALVLAEADVEGGGLHAADDVHVRLPEGSRLFVLLPDAKDGLEL